MLKMKQKISVVFCVLVSFVIVSPVLLFAEGIQQKIKQRINAPHKMQYNLQVDKDANQMGTVGGKYDDRYDQSRDELMGNIGQIEKEIPERQILPTSSIMSAAPSFSSYAIYRTNYKAELEEDVVTVQGKVIFEVFKKGWTQIPLVRSSVGLIDVGVNSGAVFVTMQGGKYYLMIDKPGKYNLDIEFLIKAVRERESGPGNFSFEVMSAPISQFEFAMPETGVEIFVEPSIKLEVKKETKRTLAWAVMPNTDTITVRWTKALPKETITPVKLEPKVYLDTATYSSVGEGLIRCQAAFNYSILQSEVPTIRLVLPEDVSILEVKGRDLRDWNVSSKEGLQYLDVYFNFGIKGDYALNLTYERKIGEGSLVAEIPWVKGMGVEREKGYFGLAAASNVELAVNKVEHASPIDVKELPNSIWSSSTNPILLAFKYLNHPFSIAVDVTKHEEIPVLVATVDSADYITLQTDEGKSLTKAIYQVRNNVKQFLHLILPKNATLWSAFVAGKPVKPAKDKFGEILIPLEKSQFSGENLTQFPVEIVYLDKLPKMILAGNLKLNLPQTDIPVSSLNWAVYLPMDFIYFNFGGDVKPVKGQRQRLGLFDGVVARRIDYKKGEKLSGYAQSQIAPLQEFAGELKTAQMKGVLPIKIAIPEVGRVYNFSKLLIAEKESPWFSVVFITAFKKIHGFLSFLIFIAILSAVAVFVKNIFKKK